MLSRKFVFWVALHLSCGLPLSAHAQDRPVTLFQNVRIFDGKSATLSAPSNVLVRGNKIETISTNPSRSIAGRTRASSRAAAAR